MRVHILRILLLKTYLSYSLSLSFNKGALTSDIAFLVPCIRIITDKLGHTLFLTLINIL